MVTLQLALNCGSRCNQAILHLGKRMGEPGEKGHQKCPTTVSTIPPLAAFKADFQGMWSSSNPEWIGHKPIKGRDGDNHVKIGRFCWSTSLEQQTEITIGVITLTFKLSEQKMLKICSDMLYLWLTRGKGDESTGNTPLMFELHTQVSCLDFWGFFIC